MLSEIDLTLLTFILFAGSFALMLLDTGLGLSPADPARQFNFMSFKMSFLAIWLLMSAITGIIVCRLFTVSARDVSSQRPARGGKATGRRSLI
jgi:hypothetical protein